MYHKITAPTAEHYVAKLKAEKLQCHIRSVT